LCLGQQEVLFSGAYRVDAFSQVLKLVFTLGLTAIVLLSGGLPDIRAKIQPEYFLFLTLSATGLVMLVSCVDVLGLVIALELSSFPLYLMVPMRREREGQRAQMESAIKYIMFGVAANGIMLFGLSYLFGLTGTTSLPLMATKLAPLLGTPLAVGGLALTFAGLYYKLAVFPFHFWTPDVYQGASNETASLIASLPKLGAVAVLVRLVSLPHPGNQPSLRCSPPGDRVDALRQPDRPRADGLQTPARFLRYRPCRLRGGRPRRAQRRRLCRRPLLHHRLPASWYWRASW
jgi:NADH-quinone oxidoreductase subunit N